MRQEVYIPTGEGRLGAIERLGRVLAALPMGRYRVTIEEAKPKRTESQNSLLWAIYTQILSLGGEEMGGWTKEDLHEYFLMSHFGEETYQVFDRKRLRPLRRSSKLNKQEFSYFIAHIQQFMAERGIFIADPA
jgi:hypothetical protein